MLAVMIFCGPMTAQTQNEQEFEVTEGDFNVVKQKDKTGTVTFDYDKAKMGNLSRMTIDNETLLEFLEKNDEKAFKNWEEYKQEGKEMFIKRWNEEDSKCIKLIEKGDADYQIKIKAELVDAGNAGASSWSMNKRGGGIVISGTLEGVAKATEKLQEAGVKRVLPLKVGGAFHSPLMEPARVELAEAINSTQFNMGICPIYQNVTGQSVSDPEIIKKNLVAQLTSPVCWTQTMQNMIANGLNSVTEVGPGTVLQGLFKKVDRNLEMTSASFHG